jgi:protein-L-isoaspartate O-methyltransferase
VTATDICDRAALLAADLARQLTDDGVLHSPEWRAALRTVLRHQFVPRYLEQQPDGSWRTVSGDDPDTVDEWLAAVYANRPLTTAVRTDTNGHTVAISSSSKPGLMVRMLETLDISDGHRVLEIGTGTGWNAGLLCHRLGAANVVSVDIEADLVATARDRLAELGFAPVVAAVDGAQGFPDAGPFDRIMATCSVARVPWQWVEQLAPDGRLLTDLKITGAAGNLVDLRRTATGMQGRFLPQWAGFMPLRDSDSSGTRAARRPGSVERTTIVPTARPWWDQLVVWFLAALHLPPGITTGVTLDPERRTPVAATMHAEDGAWAEVRLEADDAGHRMVRGSAEDLWAAVEDAYTVWERLGRPGWADFGVTITEREQRAWYGVPDGEHSWALPDLAEPARHLGA